MLNTDEVSIGDRLYYNFPNAMPYHELGCTVQEKTTSMVLIKWDNLGVTGWWNISRFEKHP
jgi:hypothetical protein